ncbi:ATP-binding protein [Cronobacter sakazakii]|uniref:ATP-binding protein n=1 Tax=Cronobacter sakazakii TaxID=28141 RepID=UPI000CFC884D|nr:ATP-binding protein [Cronobacter sakazakii]ELY2648572.1 ATP-binding protein [Cronobacter sakazakii]ELY2685723.1 ATP-binding protein [Cronobacter sakazakii]ELY2727335.1 ATP-binding protein [Cronobacter sakazakii]EME1903267.1 ATP-binding protein [Cronobacter sakazakii]EME1956439.1 ATP-binding protein [Cronobacter sakazakii]
MSVIMTLPARLDALGPLADALAQFMAPLPVDDGWRFEFDLAVCEAAANVIRHALQETPESTFTVEFQQDEAAARVVFTDDGNAIPDGKLDAARAGAKDDDVALMSEGGRGLMLIVACVDDVDYRAGQINRLTLCKRFLGDVVTDQCGS